MDLGLTDQVAIVTGSSRGLGLASAMALAAEGCRVCLCARTESPLAQAERDVGAVAGAAERVMAVRADVSTPDGAERVVAETVARFGRLDILVNNVAMAGGAGLLETTDADWQNAIDQTLFPAIRASRAAMPHMERQGGGVMIFIASIFG